MLDNRTLPLVDVVRLRQSIGRLSRRLAKVDAVFGLTPTQASLLATVARLGPVGMSEVSRIERINATVLSRAAGTLESLGLVQRVVDTLDRRTVVLVLTPNGRRLLRRLRNARSNALRQQVDLLPRREQQRLAAVLPVLELLVDRLDDA